MQTHLQQEQITQFIRDGYTRVDQAFPRELAMEAQQILWKDTGCDPQDPGTWIAPVIRLGNYAQEPFRQAANTPLLRNAYNQLAGEGNWYPRGDLGAFPVRFPSEQDPGDTGWHVDASFAGADPMDFFGYRVNIFSKGRALLMLFLFSDVETNDAPTRIRAGSHLDVARILQPHGHEGLGFMELAGQLDVSAHRSEVLATGPAGTVYLCHPFLAHAAQPHHGRNPRFMAQPPLVGAKDFIIEGKNGEYNPVEQAIRLGLGVTSSPE